MTKEQAIIFYKHDMALSDVDMELASVIWNDAIQCVMETFREVNETVPQAIIDTIITLDMIKNISPPTTK